MILFMKTCLNSGFLIIINRQVVKILPVIFLPAQPASFTHNFVSGMQSFHFSESQDAVVLQTCHEK